MRYFGYPRFPRLPVRRVHKGLLNAALPLPAAAAALLLGAAPPVLAGNTYQSEVHEFRVATVVAPLAHPWAIAFLPDDSLLVTERGGRLLHHKGGRPTPIGGLPEVTATGQGGLLDIVLHPDFPDNHWIYLSQSTSYDGGIGTTVTRARLDLENRRIEDLHTIYRMPHPPGGGQHFGSRLAFDPDGYLFVTIGDRGERNMAQRLDRAHGKLLRLHEDGSIPNDNPFVGVDGALPEIYSYGHRNGQGLYIDSVSGEIWKHEHGPRGGDTLMLIRRGANYGWPVATYGTEYGTDAPIGDLPHERDDIEEPLTWWGPTSIAPSGLTRYSGTALPEWHGDLFIGALVQEHIRRVVVADGSVEHEEDLLRGAYGRIRDVRTSPGGFLYFATDHSDGGVYRIEPVAASWWSDLPGQEGWRDSSAEPQVDIGWVFDAYWPWVFTLAIDSGAWLWIVQEGADPFGFHAYRHSAAGAGWIYVAPASRQYYDYGTGAWQEY